MLSNFASESGRERERETFHLGSGLMASFREYPLMVDEAVVLISNWQPWPLFILPLSQILDLRSMRSMPTMPYHDEN